MAPPILPQEARILRLLMKFKEDSFQNFSSETRHPPDTEGNIAQREFAGNFEEPS